MGQVQALSRLLLLNAWDVGCNIRAPRLADWKSLPKRRETAEKVEIPVAAGCKSLPKQRKSVEKVENPTAAVQESLPK